MGRLPVAILVAILVASVAVGAPAAGSPSPRSLSTSSAQQFDQVEFHINVYPNGSARWTFRYGKTLSNQSEREQFRSFASSFENGSSPLYEDFRSKAHSLASRGSNVTGRTMVARDFSKDASIRGLNDDLGVVEMSFTWTNFASVDSNQVVVGDVFQNGLYISQGQRLVVEARGDLHIADTNPAPYATAEDTSATWMGEKQFTDQHPRVVLIAAATTTTPAGQSTTPAGQSTTTDNASGGPGGGGPGGAGDRTTIPWLLITGFAAIVVIGSVMLWQRVGGRLRGRFGGAAAGTGDGGDGPGDGGGPGGQPAVPDEEMLTDEERVLSLLRENGGRMRQVNIVEETGWSKSKVSMLLSDMEDADQVRKLRVGRENIVSLPGQEPAASGSPYDDE